MARYGRAGRFRMRLLRSWGAGRVFREDTACVCCVSIARWRNALGERVVARNESFVAVVPFWAVWPFEVMILPGGMWRIWSSRSTERDGLAAMLQAVTRDLRRGVRYAVSVLDGVASRSRVDGVEHPEWHFHAHFYPPLLRSATIRKFMVGFELLGSPQRDITPESAAETLRQAAAR